MGSGTVDDKFYEVAKKDTFASRVVIAARNRIYDDFVRICGPRPDDTILDVGVSDVITDADNVLERRYPYPDKMTACGLGEGEAFRAAYSGVAYVRIAPGAPLPFADSAFDIVCSNAVLEHVGGAAARAALMAELLRVGRRVFVTVPNRFFPIEHHTGIPLLHFSDMTFAWACAVTGKRKWTEPENLDLMSRAKLAALQPVGRVSRIVNTGILLGPFSSNLALVVEPAG